MVAETTSFRLTRYLKPGQPYKQCNIAVFMLWYYAASFSDFSAIVFIQPAIIPDKDVKAEINCLPGEFASVTILACCSVFVGILQSSFAAFESKTVSSRKAPLISITGTFSVHTVISFAISTMLSPP
jgi:hypothetical protein